MTNKQLTAIANLQAENAKLRNELEIYKTAFAPIFFPSSFLLYGDDDKPIRQVWIEIDNYSDDVVLKNRHGGTNSGRPITKLVLDCVNAVMEAQWKYTQLRKEEDKQSMKDRGSDNMDEITIQDLHNTGFKSIGEAWDAYCEVTENYLGMGAELKYVAKNKRFVKWIKNMAAACCEDMCDDSGLGEEDGNEY